MNSPINEQQGNCLPVNPLATKSKKSVSFNSSVRVKKTIHINNYTEQEIANTWWSREEEQQIREVASIVADMMSAGKQIDENKISRRGLEGRTMEAQERRLDQRIAVWDAVLDAQAENFEAGIVDDEMIAMVSRAQSYKCQIAATMMASIDEQTVQEINRKPVLVKKSSVRNMRSNVMKSPTPASRVNVIRRLSCRAA